jgi:hypothetical protein
MKRSSMLLLVMCCGLVAPTAPANAAERDSAAQSAQQEEQSLDTPVADPYTPPPGGPDQFAGDEIPGESTSPLNPAED